MTEEVQKINVWKKKEKKIYKETINKIYQVGESKEWAEAYCVLVDDYCASENDKKKEKKKEKDNKLTMEDNKIKQRTKKQETEWKKINTHGQRNVLTKKK